MAGESDDGVWGQLREIRGDIAELRQDIREIRTVQDKHTLQFEFLAERVEMLREATLTSVGIAIESTAREKRLEATSTELTQRVEKLEKAK